MNKLTPSWDKLNLLYLAKTLKLLALAVTEFIYQLLTIMKAVWEQCYNSSQIIGKIKGSFYIGNKLMPTWRNDNYFLSMLTGDNFVI